VVNDPGPITTAGLGPVQAGMASRTFAVSTNCSKRTIKPPRTTK
jgi:hypothetical protein